MNIDIHTKYVVFIFALVVIYLPIFIDQMITVEVILTGLLNAVLLSLTAMKSYDTIISRAISKMEEESPPEDALI